MRHPLERELPPRTHPRNGAAERSRRAAALSRLPAVVVAVVLVVPPSRSGAAEESRRGLVVTGDDRIEGRIELQGDSLRVTPDGETSKLVRLSDVLFAHTGEPLSRVRGPQSIRLRGGEVLQADILRLAAGELELRAPLLGRRKIDAGLVEMLEFLPAGPPPAGLRPGWLYRTEGEPTPGRLLWLDADRLGVDSPLGVLSLQRGDVARYVFPKPSGAGARDGAALLESRPGSPGRVSAPVPGVDPATDERVAPGIAEVLLSDSTVLRGRLELANGRVGLHHALLGKLEVSPRTFRSLARSGEFVADLTRLRPTAVTTAPLIAAPLSAGPARMDGLKVLASSADAGPGDPLLVKALRVEPHTVVRYRILDGAGKRQVLRTLLAPAGDSRGDARLMLRVGGIPFGEVEVPAGSRARWLSLDLPQGEELQIEVDFGRRLLFPCAVLLAEPHILQRERQQAAEGEQR